MQSSGFQHAPASKYFLLYLVVSALLVTATDTKHYFYLHLGGASSSSTGSYRHWQGHWQWWRVLSWSAAFTNSTEVLFAAVTMYQLRVVERLWGTRKFLSFVLGTLPYTILLPPLILLVVKPLTFSAVSFLPSGPVALIFALLAQYQAAVPYTYRYRIATSSSSAPATASSGGQSDTSDTKGIELTSKSISYLPALQLALSQLPGSVIPAAVGWAVGYAWRLDLLPWPSSRWRVPKWVVAGNKIGRLASSSTEESNDERGEAESSGVSRTDQLGNDRRRVRPGSAV